MHSKTYWFLYKNKTLSFKFSENQEYISISNTNSFMNSVLIIKNMAIIKWLVLNAKSFSKVQMVFRPSYSK